MRAGAWYRQFRTRFDPDRDETVKSMYAGRGAVPNSRWTSSMFKFLKSMAGDLDYSVAREKQSPFDQRFDMRWENESGRDVIVIEHENVQKGVKENEVDKLLNTSGELRILITYAPTSSFPDEKFAEDVLAMLNKSVRDGFPSFELLVVLGTRDRRKATDWVGWEYSPTFQKRPLILPYLDQKAAGVKSWITKTQTGN